MTTECFRCQYKSEDEDIFTPCDDCEENFCADCTTESGWYSDDGEYYCEDTEPSEQIDEWS